WFHARAAAGRLGDSLIQLADGVRRYRYHRPGMGDIVARVLRSAFETPGALRNRTRLHRPRPGKASGERWLASVRLQTASAAQLLGHRTAALSRRPDLGHAHLLGAALSFHHASFRPEANRAVRLDALPRGGFWLHVRRLHRDSAPKTRGHPD